MSSKTYALNMVSVHVAITQLPSGFAVAGIPDNIPGWVYGDTAGITPISGWYVWFYSEKVA